MKKLLFFIAATMLSAACINAEDVVIKSPGYFDEPIRDGHPLFPDSLVYASDAEEIVIPDVTQFGRIGNYNFPNLKKVTFGNVDYVPGGLFMNMPALEEVVFDGLVGHFDCALALHCPNLRKISFRGPVADTGGPGMFYDIPNLESVVFESVVGSLGVRVTPEDKCPKLEGFSGSGAFLEVGYPGAAPVATVQQIRANPRLIADLERLADWQVEVLKANNSRWMRKSAYQSAKAALPFLEQLHSPKVEPLKAAMQYAWNLGDDVKTKLDILKASPAYAPDTLQFTFTYAQPSDSLLTLSRERFNLDSIAGDGDDISRIKNLLYWVHDNIEHNGSNGLAPGPRNLRNTYDSARRDSCGYNCRALAICLTEALLAEGIPARYITCLPKDWENDNDCHVICVAWSQSLGKWIWVDPTFAAYVTDENGLLLHPGEVRYRLRHDLSLIVNEDANWNHRSTCKKDYYLDYYMAKNLFIFHAISLNQAEPEGPAAHPTGRYLTLAPEGYDYPNTHYLTTDDCLFWQSPEN